MSTLIFFIVASLSVSVRAQILQRTISDQIICSNNSTYTNNSTYQDNLTTLLSTLSANVDRNGFYNASLGLNPDRANAIVLCQADLRLDFCRTCIENATASIVQRCPFNRQADFWNDFCMLRYSNVSIVGSMDTEPAVSIGNSQSSVRPREFMSDLRILLENITSQVSGLRKVAYGDNRNVGFQPIFALGQCTPDLSARDCFSCLTTASEQFPGCCDGAIGARVLQPSCNLRYETYVFYNETRLLELVAAMPMPPLPSQPAGRMGDNNNKSRTRTIIIIVVSLFIGVIILVSTGILIWRRQKPKEENEIPEQEDGLSIMESLQYNFSVIRSATNDFSEVNKLGQGGFGAVYKGKLPHGQEIAVKRLERGSFQGDREFKNEVMLLARLQHRNLVRLIGSSLEGLEKLLVYEFVQNASLDHFLFEPTRSSQLDWERRYKIIGGIVRGILYLHEDSRIRIIHRDLKASNVLLDGEMNPKIADFGMARLFVSEKTHANTGRIVGTYGYMAPEYATRGKFSVKSDVFSFGVLLLEIISGQKTDEDLISIAWENWRNGTPTDLVDPVLRVGLSIPGDILRCIHIGLLCVQENANERPTMASVLIMLNSPSVALPVPSPPGFYRNGEKTENLKKRVHNEGASSNYISYDTTISDFDPR